MWRWRAAPATEPVRTTARRVSMAGKSAALIINLILSFDSKCFTRLHNADAAGCFRAGLSGDRFALDDRSARGGVSHGTHAARQGLGGAHGADAPVRADPAPDRPPPDPRGDHAAGL